MLLMFRLPNADVCWVAVWRAKRYLASELRKQLNVVDNWSWCGIHSSLSEVGLSPSRGGWTAHVCESQTFISSLTLHRNSQSDMAWKAFIHPTKRKKLSAQRRYLYRHGYLIKQTCWTLKDKMLRNSEIFHFHFWAKCQCVNSFDTNASNNTLLITRNLWITSKQAQKSFHIGCRAKRLDSWANYDTSLMISYLNV